MHKRTALLSALALFALCLCASGARADTVVLTGGTASTTSGLGSVSLSGPDFVLNYSGETSPSSPMSITFNTVTLSFGSPTVTYNGVTAHVFSGGLTFGNSLLTGNVTAYLTPEDMFFQRNALFMVNFSGAGFLTVSTVDNLTRREFTVTPSTATPEPLTLLLFGTGLAGVAAVRRRRRGELAHQNESDRSQ